MGYKSVKNSQKKFGRVAPPRTFLKRFTPDTLLQLFDYQSVTYQIQLTEYRQPLLACAKPLHKLVTY